MAVFLGKISICSETAVTAYFISDQLLLFVFAEQHSHEINI